MAGIGGIASIFTDDEPPPGSAQVTPEPNWWDRWVTKLEMSHWCGGDLNIAEDAAQWLLIDTDFADLEIATHKDYARAIALLEALCRTWREEGDQAVARVLHAGDTEQAVNEYLDSISRAAIATRVAEIQTQLERLGDPGVIDFYDKLR